MKRVAVTGGAGQIAYSLVFRIASGEFFGNEDVALHLLDVVGVEGVLEGVAMELEDGAFPRLKEVRLSTDPEECFEGVHYALLVGAKPRGPGMERKDLLGENGKIFQEQGRALGAAARRDVRVLVVGNPCNTNCLIAAHCAPQLDRRQFFAMMRLDQNRAVSMLAKKNGVNVDEVKRVTIWGNHSMTQVPDFSQVLVRGKEVDGEEFVSRIRKRGAEVIAMRGKSSAGSAAQAILDSVRSMEEEEWSSMGVYSEGNSYGIDEDLIFSFPFRAKGGEREIISGLAWDPVLRERILVTEQELQEERAAVAHLLK